MAEEIVEATKVFSPVFYISIIVLILLTVLVIFLMKKGRGNFKPNLWKVIFSAIAVILWILIQIFLSRNIMCKLCVPTECTPDYGSWMIVGPACDCGCQSFFEMLQVNIQNIIIPFALVYVIWSLIQNRR